MRSGQKATSTDRPRSVSSCSTSAGDAGVDRAAQHEQLPVAQVGQHRLERARDRLRVGVEVLVDGRADDHHDVAGLRDDGRVGRGAQLPGGDGRLELVAGAGLVEGQHGVVDQPDGGLTDVVDQHRRAAVGEGDRQRQPHVPTAADHDEVVRELVPLMHV